MKKKLIVLLVAIIVALGAGVYYLQAQPVQLQAKEVTPQELKQMIEQDDNFFVYYYSPTCPKCEKAEPLIAKAVQASKVRMVAVNVKDNPDTKTEMQVPGTPTIYYYKNHKLAKGITGAFASDKEYTSFFKEAVAAN